MHLKPIDYQDENVRKFDHNHQSSPIVQSSNLQEKCRYLTEHHLRCSARDVSATSEFEESEAPLPRRPPMKPWPVAVAAAGTLWHRRSQCAGRRSEGVGLVDRAVGWMQRRPPEKPLPCSLLRCCLVPWRWAAELSARWASAQPWQPLRGRHLVQLCSWPPPQSHWAIDWCTPAGPSMPAAVSWRPWVRVHLTPQHVKNQ